MLFGQPFFFSFFSVLPILINFAFIPTSLSLVRRLVLQGNPHSSVLRVHKRLDCSVPGPSGNTWVELGKLVIRTIASCRYWDNTNCRYCPQIKPSILSSETLKLFWDYCLTTRQSCSLVLQIPLWLPLISLTQIHTHWCAYNTQACLWVICPICLHFRIGKDSLSLSFVIVNATMDFCYPITIWGQVSLFTLSVSATAFSFWRRTGICFFEQLLREESFTETSGLSYFPIFPTVPEKQQDTISCYNIFFSMQKFMKASNHRILALESLVPISFYCNISHMRNSFP